MSRSLYSLRKNGVPELSSDYFNKKGQLRLIKPGYRTKAVLIMFYAPWCPHCHTAVDLWTNLAEMNDVPELKIAAINCEKEKELSQRAGIEGFPTIKLLKPRGEMIDYNGARDLNGIVDFLNHSL